MRRALFVLALGAGAAGAQLKLAGRHQRAAAQTRPLRSPVYGYVPPEDGPEPSERCAQEYRASLAEHESAHRLGCASPALMPPRTKPAQCGGGLGDGQCLSAGDCLYACFALGADLNGSEWRRGEPRWGSAVWNATNLDCLCAGQVVISGTVPAEGATCDAFVLQIPLGCLFTGPRSCIAAPAGPGGCVWTMDECCLDANGIDLDPLREIIPWWAWGVGALLLLVSSLLGLLLRSRARRQRALYRRIAEDGSRAALAASMDTSARLSLIREYEAHFEHLAEAEPEGAPAARSIQEGGAGAAAPAGEPALPAAGAPGSPAGRAGRAESAVSGRSGGTGSSKSSADQCPVCFEGFQREGPLRRLTLHCAHRLCLQCMQQVARVEITDGRVPSCPLCRSLIHTDQAEDSSDSLPPDCYESDRGP